MAPDRHPLWLGAHLTISQGLVKAAELARDVGANTFAYFTRNPRGGGARAIPAEEIAAWQEARGTCGITGPTVGHMPYVVNMAAKDDGLRKFAATVVAEDFERVAAFGGEFMVIHPGSHVGQGVEAGIARVVETLTAALPEESPTTMLLLETMSGSGSEVGGSFQEILAMIEGAGSPPTLGVCLDTCHLFAQGYDFRVPEGLARLKDDIDATIGREKVRAVHFNDSRMPMGSHRDRHANLGEGEIGREGLVAVLTDPWLSTLPFVLETPVDDPHEYADEISRARAWLDAVS